ncbi:MAG TPA: NYN domain-containing protein [Streptosporangiaceae bacterium]|nr:NYN domain-containing protein [Streptosporangiaceae bacterium]
MRSPIIDTGPEERLDRPLPEAVRQHVVEAAAELIGTLPPEEVPAPLRRIAKFEPRKRAKRAATPIAAQLEGDEEFRTRVVDYVREAHPGFIDAIEAGAPPAAADPVQVAAIAYLVRPAGWTRYVEAARSELERSAAAAEEAAAAQEIAMLREQLTAAKSVRAEEIDKLRGELRDSRTEVAELRRKLHEARQAAKAARERADALAAETAAERSAAAAAEAAAHKEIRKVRGRLAEAEAAAEYARRAAREGRSVDDARLRVLLDALMDAAQGLRRELALPATISRPADTVSAVAPAGPGLLPGRALSEQDPGLFDKLLTLPQVHLIVDGYNVTKTGYGELPLADQRNRLVTRLGGLASQTKAEITCVFDGADLDAPVAITAPRGVRVLFSPPGETADELIGRLVRTEPAGRAVVVVSSDREVADAARRAGARPASSALLLRRLARS